ncbi:ABC transporter substrate-binding protein [Corynebacterium sp. HS2168-gen11]|uniref:ABC transporter substrate-binding protein n=1 Tax=Corynebacterium sp. HS2168-gen11 TaxID=2974027 RepID=UPI00216B0776|nr:ABC transporter substrate-binding protein [Corynebacterium sp. HS2168-gen11]MCS4534790.1 ABC transporter substrate-binding protein [Corynebacterium sp. HS2168-gen11]
MTLYKKISHRYRVALLATASATLLTGCVTNTEGGTTNASGETLPGAESGLPAGWTEIKPAKVDELAALVPAEIAADGKISIGTNPPFAPVEFKDAQGNVIGFDIDLARAVAAVLGLELEVQDLDFSLILPQVDAGTVDFGASGFTDNEERRKSFDFVNYFNAGIQWATTPEKKIDPDNACGATVAVQRTTVSDTVDVDNRSAKCVAEGKEPINKLAFDTSDTAANAVILGQADAFSGDSPISAWAVERSQGKMILTGDVFDAAHYGWPVPKGSELAPVLAKALQHLIDSGDYDKILAQWGLTNGKVEAALINGASIN